LGIEHRTLLSEGNIDGNFLEIFFNLQNKGSIWQSEFLGSAGFGYGEEKKCIEYNTIIIPTYGRELGMLFTVQPIYKPFELILTSEYLTQTLTVEKTPEGFDVIGLKKGNEEINYHSNPPKDEVINVELTTKEKGHVNSSSNSEGTNVIEKREKNDSLFFKKFRKSITNESIVTGGEEIIEYVAVTNNDSNLVNETKDEITVEAEVNYSPSFLKKINNLSGKVETNEGVSKSFLEEAESNLREANMSEHQAAYYKKEVEENPSNPYIDIDQQDAEFFQKQATTYKREGVLCNAFATYFKKQAEFFNLKLSRLYSQGDMDFQDGSNTNNEENSNDEENFNDVDEDEDNSNYEEIIRTTLYENLHNFNNAKSAAENLEWKLESSEIQANSSNQEALHYFHNANFYKTKAESYNEQAKSSFRLAFLLYENVEAAKVDLNEAKVEQAEGKAMAEVLNIDYKEKDFNFEERGIKSDNYDAGVYKKKGEYYAAKAINNYNKAAFYFQSLLDHTDISSEEEPKDPIDHTGISSEEEPKDPIDHTGISSEEEPKDPIESEYRLTKTKRVKLSEFLRNEFKSKSSLHIKMVKIENTNGIFRRIFNTLKDFFKR
jgi:hypothetical protein